jgi:DNA-binding winged helix-turn-helix (wHTH) protein
MTTRASAVYETLPAMRNKGLERAAPTPIGLVQPKLYAASNVRLSDLDLDNYQLALVPLEATRPADAKIHSPSQNTMLFLPLTLKHLANRLDKQEERPPLAENHDNAHFGDVRVDFLTFEVTRAKRLVQLSAMEFKVLKFCVSNPKRVISREELLNEVWGYNNYPCTRTVDNHILRLRQKLEPDTSNPVHFLTARGFGYRFIP